MSFPIYNSISCTLVGLGIMLMIYQLIRGHTVTSLSDGMPWGIYVEAFFFFSAIGAGALIVSAVLNIYDPKKYYNVCRFCCAFSAGSLVSAGILLGADLGRPLKLFRMVVGFNRNSPLTWDFCLLSLCLVLNLIFLSLAIDKYYVLMAWSVVSLVVSMAFIMLHALFFVAKSGSGFQSQPFLALNILLQSLLGGVSVVVFFTSMSSGGNTVFAEALLILLALSFAITFGTKVCISGTGATSPILFADKLKMVLSLIAFVLIFYAIASGGEVIILLRVAVILVFTVIFIDKSHHGRSAQRKQNMAKHYNIYDSQVTYFPSLIEILITLSSFGFCALTFKFLVI